MGRTLGPAISLTIEANTTPCAHTCRYCSIGDRGSPIDINRYLSFVDRFIEWAKKERTGLKVGTGFLPSYDYDVDTFRMLDLWFRRNAGITWNWISLGGLKMRGDDEMRRWLVERQEAGLVGISGTFVGHGAVHDRWNGRHGDFDFMMRTMRTGVELGLEHCDQHMVIKDSLPLLREAIAMFDTLPTPPSIRSTRIPFFIGHNVHHEAQRIDESDRAEMPALVTNHLPGVIVLRSEREWIDAIQLEDEPPMDILLRLELDGRNIGQLEAMPCEDIFNDLESRARATLSKIPSMQELTKTSADATNTRIYAFSRDVDRRWIHRFLQANPMLVDYKLLHYHLGASFRPPRLWELEGTSP